MSSPTPNLPAIPAKRYFTIGEVAELCGVKPHVLRYWEQEFTQLNPMKRRGNRRYYQHHEVLMVRRIRDLLYEQGFTISGARHQLEMSKGKAGVAAADINGSNGAAVAAAGMASEAAAVEAVQTPAADVVSPVQSASGAGPIADVASLRRELEAILSFLA
ncbi:MAG: hypothetical protein RL244_1859 [Pseudomonadota bacterium]